MSKIYDGNIYYENGIHEGFMTGFILTLPRNQSIKCNIAVKGINCKVKVKVKVTKDGVYLISDK